MGSIVVLNATYEVLTEVTWQRAVTMVVTGEAEIHEADPDRSIHSAYLIVPFPKVIRLIRYVYVKWIDKGHLATKRGVLARDKHTCAYCGRAGDTVDHVLPQSRGGLNTWENMVASCRKCNGKKDNRTPEEAGMPLRWQPYRPDRTGYTQKKIWAGLATVSA